MPSDAPQGVVVHRYGGRTCWETDPGRFYFPSLSNPREGYLCDITEKECTCRPFQSRQHPDGLCVHFRTLIGLLKKLQTSSTPTKP